jgi:methyltransferase-like protein/2-polyprenyl-3-methyl-5-hydroxy-6-metoxy-1,4-benzoquinol methylase
MQTLEQQKVSTYDQVPAENFSFPQSHPDRLKTLATMFGLKSADIATASVLELGCASGGNLIPLAVAYPNAKFVGVELSARQVADGQAVIEKLGLKNIELKNVDLLDVTKDLGVFDYIIAHAVFSWVPKPVQDKILEICKENLAPEGIAYVSYNTYPGWHHRGMIRDMMLYHTAQFPDAQSKAIQARALLDFLSKSVPANNAYGMMLKNEVGLLSQQRDNYLLHDHLETENEPVYFHQFAEEAAKHGLQYLSEADFNLMLTSNFAPEVADVLRRLSNDIVRTEQYMDFVRNRAFRQTLLCHQGAQLNRNLDWSSVSELRFACPAATTASKEQLSNNESVQFALANGVTMAIGNPLVKTAFHHLSQIWPRSASFTELLAASKKELGSVLDGSSKSEQQQLLGADLLTAYAAGVIAVRSSEPELVTELSSHPKVSELVQHQARTGQRITNQLHESVDADIFVRNVLVLLDGTRDVQQIVSELEKVTKNGALNVQKDGRQLTEGPELNQALTTVTEESLARVAKSALLVG